MRNYCGGGNSDVDILDDFQVLSSPEYEFVWCAINLSLCLNDCRDFILF
jgi:hypothetical protein